MTEAYFIQKEREACAAAENAGGEHVRRSGRILGAVHPSDGANRAVSQVSRPSGRETANHRGKLGEVPPGSVRPPRQLIVHWQ